MINEIAQKQIQEITEKCQSIKPLVVIQSLTYNHEPYLKDALEGFARQKTNFPFVAIVHEDASTDGTAEVLREYAEKYPDIIFPIYEKENQYSKRDGSLSKIMNEVSFATGAKYVAICEGDDYWTDINKLQKQVDFLEENSDFTMCFHNAIVHYENHDREDHIHNQIPQGEIFKDEIIRDNWIYITAGFVFKSSILNNVLYKRCIKSRKMYVGDIILILTSASEGKIYYFDSIMSVYRNCLNNFTNTVDENKIIKFINQDVELIKIFDKSLSRQIKVQLARKSKYLYKYLREGKLKNASKTFFYCFTYAPILSAKELGKFFISLLRRKLISV